MSNKVKLFILIWFFIMLRVVQLLSYLFIFGVNTFLLVELAISAAILPVSAILLLGGSPNETQ